MTSQAPINVGFGSPVLSKTVKLAGDKLGDKVLTQLVKDFVGSVPTSYLLVLGSGVDPAARLEECLRLTNFEGSSADLVGRAVHALWVETSIRDELLEEAPQFAQPVDTMAFAFAVTTLCGGLASLDQTISRERSFRRRLRQHVKPLRDFAGLLRAICAAKRLHSALLALQAAAADALDRRTDLILRADIPKVTIDDVLNEAAAVSVDLPIATAAAAQPDIDRLAAAAAERDATPGALATTRLTGVIRSLLETWLPRLADEILEGTAQLSYRGLVEVIGINADRSLQWEIYLVSVMWRQAAFALGLWRAIGEEVLDLQAQCLSLRSGGGPLDNGPLDKLELYLKVLGTQDGAARLRTQVALENAIDASGSVYDASRKKPADQAKYAAAVDALDGCCQDLVEAVRLQRLLADAPMRSFAMDFLKLAPIIDALSTTVERP